MQYRARVTHMLSLISLCSRRRQARSRLGKVAARTAPLSREPWISAHVQTFHKISMIRNFLIRCKRLKMMLTLIRVIRSLPMRSMKWLPVRSGLPSLTWGRSFNSMLMKQRSRLTINTKGAISLSNQGRSAASITWSPIPRKTQQIRSRSSLMMPRFLEKMIRSRSLTVSMIIRAIMTDQVKGRQLMFSLLRTGPQQRRSPGQHPEQSLSMKGPGWHITELSICLVPHTMICVVSILSIPPMGFV